jgi:heptosyltransferase-2
VFGRTPVDRLVAAIGIDAEIHALSPGDGRRATTRAIVAPLRRRRVDLGVLFPPSFSSALAFWLGGVGARVGFDEDRRRALLTQPVARGPRGSSHLADEYLQLIHVAARVAGRDVGSATPPAPPRLHADPAARDRVWDRLGGGARPVLTLAPGAIFGPTKRWPADSFAALADRFVRETGGRVVVTGAGSDEEVARAVTDRAAVSVTNVAGQTDFDELVAVFADSDVVVSNDSGAMHLAAATGTPVVAIFGSTNPAWTGPVGPFVTVVSRDEPCAPCYEATCDIGVVCLTRIDVDTVASAVRNAIGTEAT